MDDLQEFLKQFYFGNIQPQPVAIEFTDLILDTHIFDISAKYLVADCHMWTLAAMELIGLASRAVAIKTPSGEVIHTLLTSHDGSLFLNVNGVTDLNSVNEYWCHYAQVNNLEKPLVEPIEKFQIEEMIIYDQSELHDVIAEMIDWHQKIYK